MHLQISVKHMLKVLGLCWQKVPSVLCKRPRI